MIENDLRLRLIDLRVDDGRKEKVPALHRLRLKLLGEFQHALGLFRRKQHDFDRKISATREGREHERKHFNPRDSAKFCLHLRQQVKGGFLSLIPGLEHHSAEAITREGQLKREFRLREALERLSGGVGEGGWM